MQSNKHRIAVIGDVDLFEYLKPKYELVKIDYGYQLNSHNKVDLVFFVMKTDLYENIKNIELYNLYRPKTHTTDWNIIYIYPGKCIPIWAKPWSTIPYNKQMVINAVNKQLTDKQLTDKQSKDVDITKYIGKGTCKNSAACNLIDNMNISDDSKRGAFINDKVIVTERIYKGGYKVNYEKQDDIYIARLSNLTDANTPDKKVTEQKTEYKTEYETEYDTNEQGSTDEQNSTDFDKQIYNVIVNIRGANTNTIAEAFIEQFKDKNPKVEVTNFDYPYITVNEKRYLLSIINVISITDSSYCYSIRLVYSPPIMYAGNFFDKSDSTKNTYTKNFVDYSSNIPPELDSTARPKYINNFGGFFSVPRYNSLDSGFVSNSSLISNNECDLHKKPHFKLQPPVIHF